jgi:hypothetical protein
MAMYIAVFKEIPSCSAGICSFQAGHLKGAAPWGYATTTKAYWETVDTEGYHGGFRNVALNQNPFYTIYFDGTYDANGGANFRAYVNAGSGPQLMQRRPLPAIQLKVQASLEAHALLSNQCPSVNGFGYFGTNGSGSYSTTWSLYKFVHGSGWFEWVEPSDQFAEAPYWYSSIHNWSAFKVTGS